MKTILRICLVLLPILGAVPATAERDPETSLSEQAFSLFEGTRAQRTAALDRLVGPGRLDVAPILILALRYTRHPIEISGALTKLTGAQPGHNWNAWMKWQEAHPEAGVTKEFAKLQSRVFERIDPNFTSFLTGKEAHEIRLEEIAWGGVLKDGIPALTNPSLIAANDANYLNDSDLVFGVEINGDIRAYPLRIMDWHEMFNDVVGGVPVSLAYCTLCGSGILYETTVKGRDTPFIFGSSGFLYRSNKLMYDQQTHSLWNQFTGRPVVGTLTGSGIELKTRPVVITTWKDWTSRHPTTKVLSLETGHRRDYSTGAAYSSYFNSTELMFPTNVRPSALEAKDYVFALRSSVIEKAWPLKRFQGGAVINDTAGVLNLVLIGNAETRTVRAYRSEGRIFAQSDAKDRLIHEKDEWVVTEDALVGPGGKTLARLPGHIAYAFAWNGYFGENGDLAPPE